MSVWRLRPGQDLSGRRGDLERWGSLENVLPKARSPRRRWGPSFWGSSHARDGNYLFVTIKSIILLSFFPPVLTGISQFLSVCNCSFHSQSCPGSVTVAFCQRPSAGGLCSPVPWPRSPGVTVSRGSLTLQLPLYFAVWVVLISRT